MAIPSLLSLHGRPFIAVPSLPSLLPLPTHPNLFPARRPWVVLNSASKEASQGDQQLPQGMLQCQSDHPYLSKEKGKQSSHTMGLRACRRILVPGHRHILTLTHHLILTPRHRWILASAHRPTSVSAQSPPSQHHHGSSGYMSSRYMMEPTQLPGRRC